MIIKGDMSFVPGLVSLWNEVFGDELSYIDIFFKKQYSRCEAFCFIDNDKFPELNETLERIGNKYSVSKTTMAFAWILRHPAKMQPVTGTTNLQRLADCIKASDIRITNEEWYEIYRSAGNKLP